MKYAIVKLSAIFFIITSMALSESTDKGNSLTQSELDFYKSKRMQVLSIGKENIEFTRGVYVVLSDLIINKGQVVTFGQGCNIVLTKDKRVVVRGRLICKGSGLGGVVAFNKLERTGYYKTPPSEEDDRWDGIMIEDTGEVELNFTTIYNCKFGIQSSSAFKQIVLDTVKFVNIGREILKIGSQVITLPKDEFVSFSATAADLPIIANINKPEKDTTITPFMSVEKLKPQSEFFLKKHRTPSLWTTAIFSGVCGITAIYCYSQYDNNVSNYHSSTDPYTTTKAEVLEYKNRAEKFRAGLIVSSVLASIGSAGFLFTLNF